MNKAKVKAINKTPCVGFEGFSKSYPQQLNGVMQQQEFEQVINRINLLSKTRHSKTMAIPIVGLILGVVLFIIGAINFSMSIMSTGVTFFFFSMVIMVVMVCLFRRKVKSNLQPALQEANNYFADRRITFTLKEKQSKQKPNPVKKNKSNRMKMYIEITFPAPGSDNSVGGGILGFVQNILPFGGGNNQPQQQPYNNNNGPSFTYQPNQVNVNGVGFVPPPVNVAPQMNNGNLEFNLSAPSVAPNFNISIDADTAFKAAKFTGKAAYEGYNTFV